MSRTNNTSLRLKLNFTLALFEYCQRFLILPVGGWFLVCPMKEEIYRHEMVLSVDFYIVGRVVRI